MDTPKILFQDDDLLVIDKPPGWVVNDAKTAHGNPILQNWLKENLKYELSDNERFRSGIVHRLDKDTSGVIIAAKKEYIFFELQLQFKKREVAKSYIALVHGILKDKEGKISAPIGRLPWNRERFGVIPSGKPSETYYKAKDFFLLNRNEKFTFLELKPATGRTHQLRVHLKYIGYPIVSDTFYAGRKTSRADLKWCSRMFLHAEKIVFIHPKRKKEIIVVSQMPEDLKTALEFLHRL